MKTPIRALYLPDWLEAPAYQYLATLPLTGINRYYLAFALPNASGELQPPHISPALAQFLTSQAPSAEIWISVGGWGATEAEHQAIVGWFAAMAAAPAELAAALERVAEAVEVQHQVRVAGIDLDWEYPLAPQKGQFTALLARCRAQLGPKRQLSIAVPAEALAGYDLGPGGIAAQVDALNVMTYDRTGSWSRRADHHAPGTWTLERAQWWSQHTSSDRVIMGFPAYGDVFPGAKRAGARVSAPAYPVSFKELAETMPLATATDDQTALASSLVTEAGWVTFQSPAMVATTIRKLEAAGVTHRFMWAANGLTPELLRAFVEPHNG